MDDIPDSVAVSEAVRLAKKYEEKAGAFVNGILGSFVRDKDKPAEEPVQEEHPAEEETAAPEAGEAEGE